MPRSTRVQPGGYIYHVLNRGNGRMTIFDADEDYAALERVLAETLADVRMRLLAYCLMPNHWHLLLRPHETGDLGRFMHRLTVRHVRRWHAHRHSTGGGHLYQGPYKAFLVDTDAHFLTVARYVERNALRARLVRRAENWRWDSLWRWCHPEVVDQVPQLAAWPVDRPRNWVARVNKPETEAELDALRRSISRGQPDGRKAWVARVARRLGLESTIRPRGRPPGAWE